MIFTDAQIETLKAAVNRIIPLDEFPGGWDAGVGDYLMRQFSGDLAPVLPLYKEGLDRLNGYGFATMTPDAQDELLKRMEADQVSAQFFGMLVSHTMEGFYADPGNRGNRNGVAWEMIGFEVHG